MGTGNAKFAPNKLKGTVSLKCALIISVENYPKNGALATPVVGAIANAARLADFLADELGYAIVFCCSGKHARKTHGSKKKDIVAAVKELLREKVDEVEQLIIYIVGHGMSVPKAAAFEDILLCEDYINQNSRDACISIDELTRTLAQGLGAGSHLALLDVCRTVSAQTHSGLGLNVKNAATGVASRFQIASASKGGVAENDSLFVDSILQSIDGSQFADPDMLDPNIRWVTFNSVCSDLEETFQKHRRAWHISKDGVGNFQILKVPAARRVATIRDPGKLKVPPVRLLSYFDEISFLGETNSQLAGVPRDEQWRVIHGAENFVEQALKLRDRKWKRLDVFNIEDLSKAGRPSNSVVQLNQERDEVENYLASNAHLLAEELRIFRYDYCGFYGSFWNTSNDERRVHVSRRVASQDIRQAPSDDYIDFKSQRMPLIDELYNTLSGVRTADSTRLVFHYAKSNVKSDRLQRQNGIDPHPKVVISTPKAPASSNNPLNSRVARAFSLARPGEIISSKRAIVGPRRAGQLSEEAELARQKLARGEQPTPRERASLEQAIRLMRPSLLCDRDGLTVLPFEGNWLANLWPHFQHVLKTIQPSICRLDRIDEPNRKKQGMSSWGTGFLVAPDLLMTACHVVNELSHGSGVLENGQAQAEFEGYYGQAKSLICEITEVVKLSLQLDLALLRIESGKLDFNSRALMLDKISRYVPEFPVCTIGYPLNDPRNPMDFVSRLFEGKFGVKRAAIGEILSTFVSHFTHDCSTLGGNSGAPVIDINTGELCGVHVSGHALVENRAISAEVARDFFHSHQRPVKKSTSSSCSIHERAAMTHDKRDFQKYLETLRASDREIAAELNESAEVARTESAAGLVPEMALETIVLLKGRPVLDVNNGQAVLEFNDIESNVWKQRLSNAVPLLRPHIPAVGRIEVLNFPDTNWLATGWLLRDNIVVTNRHVAIAFAEWSGARFVFQTGLDGTPVKAQIDFIEEFGHDHSHEFPLYEIVHIEKSSGPDLAFLRIEPVAGHNLPQPIAIDNSEAAQGEQIAVIGYPARDPFFPRSAEMDRIFNGRYDKKRLAPGLVQRVTSQRLYHDCSTLGGNSGSEIVSLQSGKAVALHFAGTLFQTNHAIPVHIVNEALDRVLANRPNQPHPIPNSGSEGSTNSSATNSARVIEATVPLRIRIEIGDVIQGNLVAATPPPSTTGSDGSGSPPPPPPPQTGAAVTVTDPDADDDQIELEIASVDSYRNRKGYDSSFLDDEIEIPLPKVTKHEDDVIEFEFDGESLTELRYKNFSVVMSALRRQCRFSACNIDGKKSKKTTRPGWRFDPRIGRSLQIMKECYGNPPKFSRGHMTRREDPAWGSQAEADLGNADSMHVTNAVPQLQIFNGGVWLALEDYALKNAKKDKMRICVFTGPFLYDADFGLREVTRHGVYIPTTFWKVIAFIHDETEELTATGYTMSQESFLGDTRDEFIFGRFKTHQVPIHKIESRSGFSFGALTDVDPMRDEPESFAVEVKQGTQIRWK
jgi:endonuclease G